MSSYIKSTDFAAKDSLLTGDPLKIVSGTEINDEFNALQVAVNTKANTNSPSLTGVPLTPTAAALTSTTQIASTAFVTLSDAVVTAAYIAADVVVSASILALQLPVGSIYTNASVATNPSTLLGYGTWVAFGSGRVMVGLDAGQTEFDTLEETGGANTHTLTTAEIPAHDHDSPWLNGAGAAVASLYSGRTTEAPLTTYEDVVAADDSYGTVSVGEKIFKTTETGDGDAHSILQPYITVHAWKRTA